MGDIMKGVGYLISAVAFLTLLNLTGCATVKNLPASYIDADKTISVEIAKIPEEPKMRDSGQGGLIGVMVNASRDSNMDNVMDGLESDTVQELLLQRIEEKLETGFIVDDEGQDLLLEVNVQNWGWFCPSTAFGIRTGAYQLEINANVAIFENTPEKKKLAYTRIISQSPLGDDPTIKSCQDAMMLTIEKFSEDVSTFVFKEKS